MIADHNRDHNNGSLFSLGKARSVTKTLRKRECVPSQEVFHHSVKTSRDISWYVKGMSISYGMKYEKLYPDQNTELYKTCQEADNISASIHHNCQALFLNSDFFLNEVVRGVSRDIILVWMFNFFSKSHLHLYLINLWSQFAFRY